MFHNFIVFIIFFYQMCSDRGKIRFFGSYVNACGELTIYFLIRNPCLYFARLVLALGRNPK